MNNIHQALLVELLKARRSRIPLLTALGFAFAPVAGGFFMIVLKDPEMARNLGLISAKAQMVAGTADWPTYLGLLAQATAVGGILLFSLIASWVFGREHVDGTMKDLLALPTRRSAVVLAKFAVVALWSGTLTALIFVIGLGVGAAVGLPTATAEMFYQATATVAVAGVLTIALVPPIAFFAGLGRGYLAPMGAAILALVMAQIIAATGWGAYFPWSVPALYAGVAGETHAVVGAIGYVIVALTSLAGLVATFAWWEFADHPR